MPKVTPALIRSFNLVRSDERKQVFGGITFNDDYNLATWGITRADYSAMRKCLVRRYGMELPSVAKASDFKA